MNSKNILIPLDMLIKIADLLNYWDTSQYDYSIQCDYDCVLTAIQKKLEALQLRNAYSKIISARGDEARFFARMDYLKLRHEYRTDSSIRR